MNQQFHDELGERAGTTQMYCDANGRFVVHRVMMNGEPCTSIRSDQLAAQCDLVGFSYAHIQLPNEVIPW